MQAIEVSTLDGNSVKVSMPDGSTVADLMAAVAKKLQPTSNFQVVCGETILKDMAALVPLDVKSLTCMFMTGEWCLGPFEDASTIGQRALAKWKNVDPETLGMQPTMSSRYLRLHRLAAWNDLGEFALIDESDEPADEFVTNRVFAFTLIDGANLNFRMVAIICNQLCGEVLGAMFYLRPQSQVGPLQLIARVGRVNEPSLTWEVSDDTWYRPPVQRLPSCDHEQLGGDSLDTPLKLHLAHAISCGLWSSP